MYGRSFWVIITSEFRPEHLLALRYGVRISLSCVSNDVFLSLQEPCPPPPPPNPSWILPDIFNCVFLIYSSFIEVKHRSVITRFPKLVQYLQKLEHFRNYVISLHTSIMRFFVLEAKMLQ
jgi:hypothetical protein